MTIEMDLPALLDTSELAATLGIPKGTLEAWRAQRSGPSFMRLGRKVFYAEQDVNAWLDGLQAARLRNER